MEDGLKIRTITSLFWKFSERIIAQVISFSISIILARILMPDAYGLLALITVFITICDKLVISGFATSLIQKKDTDNIDFSSVLYFSIVIAFFLYGVLYITAPSISNYFNNFERVLMINVLRVMGIRIIISALNSVQHAYVSKHMLFKRYFFSTLGGAILSGVVGIWLAYSGFGVWALVAQYLVSSIVDTLILWFTVRWRPQLVFSMNRIKSLYSFGGKIFLASIIKTLYMDLRSLIIGKFYSSLDLAYYNRGQSFPQIIDSNVVGTIDSVLFPVFSKKQSSKSEVLSMLRRSIQISSYVTMPFLAGLAAVAKPLVFILLTEKWLPSAIYIQILSFSFILSAVEVENLQAIKAIGRSDLVLKLEIVKRFIGAFFLLIAFQYGVRAIAFSMLFSSVFSAFLSAFPNRKIFNYSFREQIKDVAAPLVMSIIMFFIVSSLTTFGLNSVYLIILQITVGVLLYIFFTWLFKIDSFHYIIETLLYFKGKGQ